MAVTVVGSFQGFTTYLKNVAHVVPLTVPAGAVALVLPIGYRGLQGTLTNGVPPTFGGKAMVKVGGAPLNELWYLLDISGRADDTLRFTTQQFETISLGAQFLGASSGIVEALDTDWTSAGAGTPGASLTVTLDAGVKSGAAAVISGGYQDSGGVNLTFLNPYGSQVQLNEQIFEGNRIHNASYLLGISGTQAVGVTSDRDSGSTTSVLAALFGEGAVEFTPDPIGWRFGFRVGALTLGADQSFPGVRMPPWRMGFRPGRMTIEAARQVALVGNGIETAGMTEDGNEGDILTYHTARKPTWEEPPEGTGPPDPLTASVAVIFDTPEADDELDVVVPYACTITSVTVLADVSGSIVVDIWKDTYANVPPTDADSITASAPPTLSSADKSQDSTLTGWTTSIAAGDVLRFHVDSVATVTRVLVHLAITRT